jgi:hypothetical protein
MVKIRHKGDFSKTFRYLKKANSAVKSPKLDSFGKEGVAALMSATPVDTGLTAKSWSYRITKTKKGYTLEFLNSNIQNGVPIAIILQYGHGTRNGGWVEGRDYINPAIQPIFDKIAESAWKEVTKL